MLINNITNDTAVYFILSNNHINDLIMHEFDPSDPDYMSYWISFVKGLSLKLNEHSVQFFFNHAKQTFPLFTEALRHFCHSESMVRIAVRTVTLKVFTVPDPGMRKFVLKHCRDVYFPALMAHIQDFARSLQLESSLCSLTSHGKLDQQTEELIDMFYYMADIYAIEFPELTDALTETMHRVLVLPLLESALPVAAMGAGGDPLEPCLPAIRIGAHVVYFILGQLVMAIRHGPAVEMAMGALLGPALALSGPSGGIAGGGQGV